VFFDNAPKDENWTKRDVDQEVEVAMVTSRGLPAAEHRGRPARAGIRTASSDQARPAGSRSASRGVRASASP
jgi:hypothetical protein